MASDTSERALGNSSPPAYPDPISSPPSTEEADELLHSPPHWATRGLVYILGAMTLFAGLAAFFIQVDLTATGVGRLVTESDVITLKAPVGGPVTAVSVREGTNVRRGDVLVQIDPQEVVFKRKSLESELIRAEEGLLLAQRERLPESDLAKLIGEVARLRSARDEAARKERQTTLRAPIDGIVSELAPRGPGDVLAEGALVAKVLPRTSPLIGEVKIANEEVGTVRVGQSVRVSLRAYSSMKYGKLRGRVVSIAPDSDPQSGAYLVRISLENIPDERRLQPGMAMNVEIITQRKRLWGLLLGTDEGRG